MHLFSKHSGVCFEASVTASKSRLKEDSPFGTFVFAGFGMTFGSQS